MRLDNRQAQRLEIILESPLCRNCLFHGEKLADRLKDWLKARGAALLLAPAVMR